MQGTIVFKTLNSDLLPYFHLFKLPFCFSLTHLINCDKKPSTVYNNEGKLRYIYDISIYISKTIRSLRSMDIKTIKPQCDQPSRKSCPSDWSKVFSIINQKHESRNGHRHKRQNPYYFSNNSCIIREVFRINQLIRIKHGPKNRHHIPKHKK